MPHRFTARIAELTAETRGFWNDRVLVECAVDGLGPGLWRLRCRLRRPAVVSLTLTFPRSGGGQGGRPLPLRCDLDPEPAENTKPAGRVEDGERRASGGRASVDGRELLLPASFTVGKTLRLIAEPRRIRLAITPPCEISEIEGVVFERLTACDIARIGWQKAIPLLGRPRLLMAKLREVFSGAMPLALSAGAGTAAGAWLSPGPEPSGRETMERRGSAYAFDGSDGATAAAYDLWRQIFESPAEQDRLAQALRNAAIQAPTMLAVYYSANDNPGALEQFLEGQRAIRTGKAPPDDAGSPLTRARWHLLVLDCARAPLPAPSWERIEAKATAAGVGLSVREVAGPQVPIGLICDAARGQGAVGFTFIERAGRFSHLAVPSFALAFERRPDALAVYGDCDRITPDGRRHAPRFKPQWSPLFAAGCDYVGAPIVFRVTDHPVLCTATLHHPGSAAFELLMRLDAEVKGLAIAHVPRVLFHEAEAVGYARHAQTNAPGREVVEAVLRDWALRTTRHGGIEIAPPIDTEGERAPWHRIQWPLPKEPPLVSILIPTKDHPALLEQAIASARQADYPAREIIVIDNGSTGARQRALLARLAKLPEIRILYDRAPFNFSRLINGARQAARGRVLLLLNDDVEAIDRAWLREMVSLAMLREVGAVGALLLYPDETIQHAGIVLGLLGGAGHAFRHAPASLAARDPRLAVPREVSAVTGACLAVRTELFDAVGGFDESLPVAWNDVDFCLKLRTRSLRNLVTPHARLYHKESATRGRDRTPNRLARLARETERFLDKWGEGVLDDPYYSPHLARNCEDFRLRIAGGPLPGQAPEHDAEHQPGHGPRHDPRHKA